MLALVTRLRVIFIGSNGSYVFFFSSRRRHTRCSRDWSSDVCSSDLGPRSPPRVGDRQLEHADEGVEPQRSEERRVGKECRSRRSPYTKKKNKKKQDDYRRTICKL